MLTNIVYHKQLLFRAMLMDSWYATRPLMMTIERLGKFYYCPLKDNRQVDESDRGQPYQRVDSLSWTETEQQHGKLKGFPKGHRLKLFRLVLSAQRTDYGVTNDLSQGSMDDVQQVSDLRWKIEQFHW